MATTNITMRMDEDLKSQLQELVANLGMDMTTFFTISAKQAVREQRIPFAIGYSDAAEPPVRCGVSHQSGQA